MSKALALIVDDEPDIRELLELTLGRMDIDTRSAADLASARRLLQESHFDLCLTDMRLPDGDGLELVDTIQKDYPELPVAVITAHGNMETAVQALKAGAFDFVSKPVDLQVLRKLVNSTLKLGDFPARDRRSRDTLLGDSAIMQSIRSTIAKLARSQAPVYISGESGTGKELVAQLIHSKGPRSDRPFVPVNCGAIPSELMESEFFGHRKGSFTGAVADKEGLFQAAEGGTLFLDEVAELPLHMQVKLLRAIQEKAVRPVGEQKERPIDVRILSATHKDLARLVEAGEFRQDLYYRINVIELKVPSLRQRREDIPQLAEHILGRLSREQGIEAPRLGREALETLQRYAFPGNVRELENILERALTLCDGQQIQVQDLALPEDGGAGGEGLSGQLPPPPEGMALEDYLEDIERQALLRALEQTSQNKTAAAKLLGITFRAMRYRLKKLGLE
ncbi:MAG TPA: sigma-54-dependent Fis family transcriptional regulator [Gammaproteobacteria bacterium]|nr:sigma-54-dependent Fis family transcriptional regulator [Gammaproteobacteria bacterium]